MRRHGLSLVWLCSAPLAANAQGTIPVLRAQVVATSSSNLQSVFGMKSLANGGVLVNDFLGRRLVAYDSTLTRVRVVLDSTTGAADSYGDSRSIILPYLGDSVVFLDSQAMAFVLFDPLGRRVRTMAAPPFARDLKALLPNGTVAIVRGHDYHIDWIRADGSKASTPKMPFDWRKISVEDKQRMLDSIKNWWETIPMRAGMTRPLFRVIDVADLPDYNPPIRQGQVFADCDGNVWILPTTSLEAGDGLVYDVVDGNGRLFQRVRVPSGRVVAGFGPRGVVYLVSTIANMRRIERAKLTR